MVVSPRSMLRSMAVPAVSAYSVLSVASAMARSVTGPLARRSDTTRISTAGDAATDTTASARATGTSSSSARSSR